MDKKILNLDSYHAIKRNQLLIHVTMSVDLKSIVLKEKKQFQRSQICIFHLHNLPEMRLQRWKAD
jgi:hypothetical protein